jgi:uncharacterized LabA/DUF88 family protein
MSETKAITTNLAEQTGINVAVFIDYDNIYHCMRNFGVNIESGDTDLINHIWKCYGKDKIRVIKAYADFEQVKVSLRSLQKKRVQIRQVYGNGLGEQYRKNASDIELSMDAIEAAHSQENIDTFVFVTADSDMIPVMSRMIFKGYKVHLYYLGENVSQYTDFLTYAHYHSDLLGAFEIDIERKEPFYWMAQLEAYIEKWHKDKRNATKSLGGKWLKEGLIEDYCVSPQLASQIISYAEENSIIVTDARKGYVVNNTVEGTSEGGRELTNKN